MFPSHLLSTRRFLPLFLTQFMGSFNDNFFKTAVVILVTYRTSQEWHMAPQTLVTLAGVLYILPYSMFCATAGKLADKYDRARIARIIKVAEVVFMLLGAIGFAYHMVLCLFFVLFCMGAHSAFFSPVKYSLLPDQLERSELMEGNAYIEGITFIAILLGTIAGGLLVLRSHGEMVVSLTMLGAAVLGAMASWYILPAPGGHPEMKLHWNIFSETRDILKYVAARRPIFTAALANSWFWFVCMTFLTLLPAFTRQIIGADEDVVTLLLMSFSIGIGAGTVACGTVLRGNVSTRFVPGSAIAMSLFIFDLYRVSPHSLVEHQGALMPLAAFLDGPIGWRMVFDLFCFAFFGGFYIVPLYAALQHFSEARYRAQVMACNNVINAFFMVGAVSLALMMFAFGFTVADVFLASAVLNSIAAAILLMPAGKI